VLTGLSYLSTGIPKIAPLRWRRDFFLKAICFGLEDYLQTYLEPSNVDINLFLKRALSMPVEPPHISLRLPKKEFLSPSIVRLLPQRGADPNGFYPQNAIASTIWQLFLYSLYDEGYDEKVDVDVQADNNNTHIDIYGLKIKVAMAEVLLRGGANPRAELTQLNLLYHSAKELPTVRTVIGDIFGRRCLWQEAASLLDVLRDAESKNQHSWQSTSRKAVREESRKRPWDHDSRETMNDYYGSFTRLVSLVKHYSGIDRVMISIFAKWGTVTDIRLVIIQQESEKSHSLELADQVDQNASQSVVLMLGSFSRLRGNPAR